jgi:hypothetical protein
MRKAILATFALVFAGCAGSSAAIRSPIQATYDQTSMMTGLVPSEVGRVEPGFGTAPSAYGPKDMGVTPPCTLADIR